MRSLRIVAAALAGPVVLAVAAMLPADAGGRASALVELQVAPRGLGAVSATPRPRDSDGEVVTEPCARNDGQRFCDWFFDAGRTVTLAASPEEGFSSSFVGWSTTDCPGTGTCSVELDDPVTTVVARFSPLALGVILSDPDAGTVTMVPAGKPCQREPDSNPDACAEFPPGTSVRVTVDPADGKTFQRWNPGCEPRDATTCTIVVLDEPTWAGAKFQGDDEPQLPTTIKVRFRLRKQGSGDGRISSSKIDCGGSCAADYDYGEPVALTATAASGSIFRGWNGVCERTQITCSFPVGPITSIRARFDRDTTPPTSPGGLQLTGATRTTLELAWSASSDDDRVAGYRVYLDDVSAGDTTETRFALQGLKCGSSHRVAVDAVDRAGNRSAKATLLVATKPCPFAMRLVGVGSGPWRGGRAVVVRLRVSRPTGARLVLRKGPRTVASGRFALRPGTNVMHLAVSPKLGAGRYGLRIAVVDPDGGTRVLSRVVRLAPPR